jgi:circadian clock protein KaiC
MPTESPARLSAGSCETEPPARLSTGVPGLDEVLYGGLLPGKAYLVRGAPGTGKTTLGLHFLTAGAAKGERTLLITLGEPEAQVRANARAVGLNLDGIPLLDLSPSPEFFAKVQTYDIFSPAEVEREPTTRLLLEKVEAVKPQRVFLDAMTQFRYLSTDTFQFRKQALSFLHFLTGQGATVLFTSEFSEAAPDDDLQFLSDGVIHLASSPDGRTLSPGKLRGSNFKGGPHSMRITSSGIKVFPRLLPDVHRYKGKFVVETIPSGVPGLDELLHGGLERGTVTIISGPAGVGKTTLGLRFMAEAAGRGERSVVYTFEEALQVMMRRCEGVNIPLRPLLERNSLAVVQVEPLFYTPDEFAQLVRQEVERQQTRVVMIDSTSGYRISFRGDDLVADLHALCKYLKNMGVTVLLVNEIEPLTGEFRVTDNGFSYLGDNILFLRYMERHTDSEVELRKSIAVLKKRVTDFEKTMRELEITGAGLAVTKPAGKLGSIISTLPVWGAPPGRTETP